MNILQNKPQNNPKWLPAEYFLKWLAKFLVEYMLNAELSSVSLKNNKNVTKSHCIKEKKTNKGNFQHHYNISIIFISIFHSSMIWIISYE